MGGADPHSIVFWRRMSFGLGGALLVLLLTLTVVFFRGLEINHTPMFVGAELQPAAFVDLPGWEEEDHAAVMGALAQSCPRINSLPADRMMISRDGVEKAFAARYGRAAVWQAVCAELAEAERSGTAPAEARQFFESHFSPWQVIPELTDDHPEPDGLFTAYFEPAYMASPVKTEEFSAPVYGVPDDLITLDLGDFRESLKGKSVTGRIAGGSFIPYADHGEITQNGLDAKILAWMDPNDLLFLQIQGSGRLELPDGQLLRAGYAGKNGRDYTAIGRELINMGVIAKEDMSMQAIRGWLENAAPEEAARVRHVNRSYVFFRELTDLPDPALGPLGAQGVQLSEGRSIAVDWRYHAYGAPVFVSLPAELEKNLPPLNRLMIAQDTGGAIRGPVRGDLFLGTGDDAGAAAGTFNRRGEMYVLLPREQMTDGAAAEQ